jgi:nucleotide-binding universal stress UspA family protein
LIEKIFVPIDGSEHADKALDYALNIAKKYSASIEILNVALTPPHIGYVSPPLGPARAVVTYSKELKANSKKMLSKALVKAKKNYPDLSISTKLLEGQPADKIVETAKKGNFDIIIMGSRGLGGIKEFFLGSVSHRVSNDAECPILIVK